MNPSELDPVYRIVFEPLNKKVESPYVILPFVLQSSMMGETWPLSTIFIKIVEFACVVGDIEAFGVLVMLIFKTVIEYGAQEIEFAIVVE